MPHPTVAALVHNLLAARQHGRVPMTLLAVCPNSAAVLEAAVKTGSHNNAPMLFAATLNQVDRDGGYTGWTPSQFVAEMKRQAEKYGWSGPLYPCLDHGGPWLKDRHTLDRLTLEQTMAEVKLTLSACLAAGYQLLHIDPTVDRTLPPGRPPAVSIVVARTVELIAHCEAERQRLGLPPVAYEVGTEEVHGGLVDVASFQTFLHGLRADLAALGLNHAWPCFVVAQVGTDLHTTTFSSQAARTLTEIVAPLGSLLKGHYTDWVENAADYPASGMGGANVGPEFTAAEYLALKDLAAKEQALVRTRRVQPSGFVQALQDAVVASGRWQKWLLADERGRDFAVLSLQRRDWLTQTGARYIWTQPAVLHARVQLYENLAPIMGDPHGYVIDCIVRTMDAYINAFNLFDAMTDLR
jgi:D-tagatose-1,6-bisphosphate aldolase subunit GatZ/KbaZ